MAFAAALPYIIAAAGTVGGAATSAGGQSKGASAPGAVPARAMPTGPPTFSAPITSQSVAPHGSLTSGLANKQISPELLALLQKMSGGSSGIG